MGIQSVSQKFWEDDILDEEKNQNLSNTKHIPNTTGIQKALSLLVGPMGKAPGGIQGGKPWKLWLS